MQAAWRGPGFLEARQVWARSKETHADMLGVETAGYYAQPYQPASLEPGANQAPVGPDLAAPFVPTYFSNRMKTIAGGSSEIQRNIIAKAVLGL